VAALVLGLGLFASVTPSPLYRTHSVLWHFSPLTLTLIYATYAFGVLAGAPRPPASESGQVRQGAIFTPQRNRELGCWSPSVSRSWGSWSLVVVRSRMGCGAGW